MRTPITYYGGKQRIAPVIVSMIPQHKIYCEPYFGGGAVFFQKPKKGIEVINDNNNALINFYQCVQNNFDDLQLLIKQTLHSEAMYLHAKDIWNNLQEASDIEKAWAIWLITNGSYAGSMHGGWKWCNGTSGGHTGNYIRKRRDDFSQQLYERLDNVQISCRDALKVVQDRDSENTFFYLDPPYPGSYQGHYNGFSHNDLFDLLQLLSRIKGRFILSNYWSQTLRYHIARFGWNFKTIEVSLRLTNLGRNGNGKGIQKRTEILVYNFEMPKTLFEI